MNLKPICAALTLLAGCHQALALGNEPFDFAYAVSGDAAVRPALVFNDGVDTWIQPRSGAPVEVRNAPAERRGAYWVVRGLPRSIELAAAGARLEVAYLAAPPETPPTGTPPCEPSARSRDQVVGFKPKSSQLTNEGRRVLEGSAEVFQRATSITVLGRPDINSARLAQARAQVMRAWLREHGVQPTVIQVEWSRDPAGGPRVLVRWRDVCPRPVAAAPQAVARPAQPSSMAATPVAPPAAAAQTPSATAAPAASGAAAPAPAVAAGVATPVAATPAAAPGTPPAAAGSPSAPAPSALLEAAPAAEVTFAAERGVVLSSALRAFLALHGAKLEWQIDRQYRLTRPVEFAGADFKAAIHRALGAFNLPGVFETSTNTLYIR